jgi:LuxR family maltose regulon positive regulatory protein
MGGRGLPVSEKHKAERTPILFFRDIDSLMYNFFWRKITPEEQEVFLRFSVFDRIEREQLANWDKSRVEEIVSLLKRAPLMRLDEQYGVLYPHEILSSFLNTQLECAAPELRDEIYRNAGKWYRQTGKTKKAICCFFHIRDYEQIMACDVTGLYNEKIGGLSYPKFADTVLSECSPEMIAKYPVSALRLCMVLFGGAEFSSFERNLERLRGVIADSGDRQMMGEWYLVSAFLDFPDTRKMKERYLQAEELMTGPSRVVDKRDPFMFGSTSMWYLFYSRPGEMMQQAAELREMMTVYNRLTENHGAGAYELYLGEALSVQGLFDESDIYAHRAALRAEQSQNVSVSYGTALLLGINAIYQSDMVALQKAIEYLENKALAYPFLQNTAINQLMTETVRGYLLGLMMEPRQSAKWTQGEADALGDLSFANFMVKTSRVTDLILQKEYKRAIASVEQSLTLDSRLISLSTRNFMYVGLTLCYLAVGHPLLAAEWLDKSLTIAEADKNYTFLASFRKYLGALFLLPTIKAKHAQAIREIRDMKISYTKAEESKIFFMLENLPEQVTGLTDREREVANLVAQGLHNREIAERLCISEETVKSHVRTIFNKMNIDRRSQLVELLK